MKKINYLDDFVMTEFLRLRIIELHDSGLEVIYIAKEIRPMLESEEKRGLNREITKKAVMHIVGKALMTKTWD